jgi:peptide/nickel transport system ATP-binding protein
MKAYRRQVQMVFQDPYSSLNPRMNIEDAVAFNALVHGASRREARAKAWDVLNKVGLRAEQFGRRYPHELSGGQRQRVNIARALVLDPKLVLLDEPVSSLDKSVQAQVLNLLQTLKHDLGLTYVFISHDLHVIEYLSDRVLVMYLGQIVEVGSAEEVSAAPLHPYTQALFASAPSMNPDERIERPPLIGDPPNPINPPSGCRFRTRCPHTMDICASATPPLVPVGEKGRQVACYLFGDGKGSSPSPTSHLPQARVEDIQQRA